MNGALNNTAFILDCTLRDGSYINNGFDPTETYCITKALDEAGVPYIEIGHGMGMGAYHHYQYITNFTTDAAHLEAAKSVITNSKCGMFFQPTIGTMKDIELLHRYGMHFIRIGVNVNDWEQSLLFIDKAKALDLFVCVNLMKTYMATPSEVAEIADEIYNRGGDCIYIVDSAGCMMPNEVDEYVSAIKLNSHLIVGFHGHNNLQLATANTVAAYAAGAELLDTTLRGIGRSGGNAMTEAFVITMQKLGAGNTINLHTLYEAAEKYIDPVLQKHLLTDNQSLVCGASRIHSSDMDLIEQYAEEWGVNKYTFAEKVGNMAYSTLNPVIDKELLNNVRALMLACK